MVVIIANVGVPQSSTLQPYISVSDRLWPELGSQIFAYQVISEFRRLDIMLVEPTWTCQATYYLRFKSLRFPLLGWKVWELY